MSLLITFVILNIINVVIQTVKSIVTIKCGKWGAAGINALAYGLYTIVIIYMTCDLPLLLKAGIIAACNLVGVFIVKYCEEKATKDKLWKIEATVKKEHTVDIDNEFKYIPHSYIEVGKHTLFSFYCNTQKESEIVKTMIEKYDAKYFVAESKSLY